MESKPLLMDVKDCARLSGVTVQAIRKAIKDGRIKAKKFGNAYAVSLTEIFKYRVKIGHKIYAN